MHKATILIALLVSLSTQCLASETRYHVTIEENSPRKAQVQARLTPEESILSLNRFGRDTGLYHGWATFIHELKVKSTDGMPIEAIYQPNGSWKLIDHDGSAVEVEYTMLLQHDRFPNNPGDDELAWARDWGIMWTGRALFLEGEDQADIAVQFSLPDQWRVSTPWQEAESGRNAFLTRNQDALLNSAFVAGMHDEVRLSMDGETAAIIVVGGDAPVAAGSVIVDLVDQKLNEFAKMFGASPQDRLLVVAADATYWGGGVMGSSISMLFGGALDENTLPMVEYIVTHEMFHLWNGSFHYAGQRATDHLQWFIEGSAEYYTWLGSLQEHDAEVTDALAVLANRYMQYMETDPGISMSVAGENKLDNYDLIYSGGMMAVAALDQMIRSETSGEHSFGDVLHAIQQKFPEDSKQQLDLSQLASVINSVTGVSADEFIQSYVVEAGRIPMEQYLAMAGLTLARNDEEIPEIKAERAETLNASQAAVWQAMLNAP